MNGWTKTAIILVVWVLARLGATALAESSPAAGHGFTFFFDATIAGALFAAALRFEAGDPPRLGWGLAGVAQLLATLTHLAMGPQWAAAAKPAAPFLIIALNVTFVVAIFVFLRNVSSSGLTPGWTRRSRVVVAGCAVFAAAVAAVTFVRLSSGAETGADLLASIASTSADAIVFVGAVLLVRMVAPMAAGAIARPYFLLAGAGGIYLLLDAILAMMDVSGYASLNLAFQAVVALAGGLLLTAPMAQLDVFKEHS